MLTLTDVNKHLSLYVTRPAGLGVALKVNKEFLILIWKTGKSLSSDNVCIVMAALARALQFLHSRPTPVIHR